MLASVAWPWQGGEMLALAVLLASSPIALECIDAHRKRSDLAVRMRALLMREVDHGGLNRAEIGTYRAIKARRERLLECPADRNI